MKNALIINIDQIFPIISIETVQIYLDFIIAEIVLLKEILIVKKLLMLEVQMDQIQYQSQKNLIIFMKNEIIIKKKEHVIFLTQNQMKVILKKKIWVFILNQNAMSHANIVSQ